MNRLQEEISKLKPSRSVFKFTPQKNWSGDSVVCIEPISNPEYSGNENNAIGRLVRVLFVEQYEHPHFVVHKKTIERKCWEDIQSWTLRFIKDNMDQKHPMETTMGKWYRDTVFAAGRYNEELQASIINIYNVAVDLTDDKDHKNYIRLFEFLFKKHRNDFPEAEPQRRQRRGRRRRKR